MDPGTVPPDISDLFSSPSEFTIFLTRRSKYAIKILSTTLGGEDHIIDEDYALALWYISDKADEIASYDVSIRTEERWVAFWTFLLGKLRGSVVGADMKSKLLLKAIVAECYEFMHKQALEMEPTEMLQKFLAPPIAADDEDEARLSGEIAAAKVAEGSGAGCSTRAGHEPFPLSKIVQGWSSGESADCKGVSSGDDRAVTAEDRYDWMTLRMCVKFLEALLWKVAVCEKHSSDASSVEKVFVSVVDDNVQFRVSLMPKTFRLNFIGDLTFIKGANSF